MTKDYNLQNGINLSTIHSSKGLEFEIVLCPYLSIISKKSNKIKGPIWKIVIVDIKLKYLKPENMEIVAPNKSNDLKR